MQTSKPTIAVLHANSKQGTSVVISLLQTGKFVVKAVVRNADSDNAKQLAAKGAKVVAVDQTNAEALRAAFEGVYGVFYVTVSLEIAVLQAEYEQGKLIADAAAAAGVKVFVFSTLENVKERTKGKYTVGPFTDKARIADYIREKHGGTMIGVFPAMAGFYTVFAGMPHLRPRKDENGVLVFSIPAKIDVPQPWVNPLTAIGPVATAAFLDPEQYRNTVIPVYDEVLTFRQMVETFSATGIKARVRQQTQADLEELLPPPVASMLCQAFAYADEFGFYAPERDMKLVRKINPHPETWADFLRISGYDGTQSEEDIRAKFVK